MEGASLARPYAPRPLYARSITWWPVAIRAGRYKLVRNSPAHSGELPRYRAIHERRSARAAVAADRHRWVGQVG